MDFLQKKSKKRNYQRKERNLFLRTRFKFFKCRICSGTCVIKLSHKSNSSIDPNISIPFNFSKVF